jgi:hypothetical protein
MTGTQDTDIRFVAGIQVGGKSLNRENDASAYLLMWSESELVDLLIQRLGKTRAEVLQLLKTIEDKTQKRKEKPCLVMP